MSSFENIKVGDQVLITVAVNIGWHHDKYFRVTRNVTRLTKTQFEVDGVMFYKKDGKKVGDSWVKVLNIGDPDGYDRQPAYDQTLEYQQFKDKVELCIKTRNKIESLSKKKIPDLLEISDATLSDLNKLLDNILVDKNN